MLPILAQLLPAVRTWGFGDFMIAVIVIAACIGITAILLAVFEIKIPPWAVKIFWIVLAAFVGIFAIRLLLGM